MPINYTAVSMDAAAQAMASHLLVHPDEFVVLFANYDQPYFHIIDATTISIGTDVPIIKMEHVRFAGTAADLNSLTIGRMLSNLEIGGTR